MEFSGQSIYPRSLQESHAGSQGTESSAVPASVRWRVQALPDENKTHMSSTMLFRVKSLKDCLPSVSGALQVGVTMLLLLSP